MPTISSSDHGNIADERPSEKRRRQKNEKDPSRPHKPKVIDPVTGEAVRSSHRRRKEKTAESEASVSMADLVPELSRTASAPSNMSRESIPYPSFSKAHSKEAVNSREDVRSLPVHKNLYTPESTDIGSKQKSRTKSAENVKSTGTGHTQKDERPPSPPDTEFSDRKATSTRASQIREEGTAQTRTSSQASQRSWFGRPKEPSEGSKLSTKSKRSKASTTVKASSVKPSKVAIIEDDETVLSDDAGSASDSNATSVAPKRNQPAAAGFHGRHPEPARNSSPDSAQDSSPRTPVATPHFAAPQYKPTPSPFVDVELSGSQDDAYYSPQPPPPPPPPMVPMNVPRVDYLMQNGGLSRMIPKALLTVMPTPAIRGQLPSTTRTPAQGAANIENVFGPFYNLLDQYETVIAKNGSVAVATGYRSVARRLLDRLENVFARDLSSEGCHCVLCELNYDRGQEASKGLGWGEVLEWVSGRRELPVWPAFDFQAMGIKDETTGLGISGNQRNNNGSGRPSSPVQMDPDIAEEFREHYLRQTKKTKVAVDKWLSSCPSTAAAPPPDIDDETLTFTISTHLDQEERPIFNALLIGSDRPVQSAFRAPTPMGKPRTDLLVKSGYALQRLYRLSVPPRDPEACIYLLRNPELHNLLATLSGINNSEWEILTSGRFDGFLWSGAESEFPGSMLNSPAASRGPTPASGMPSRGPTPNRHPSVSRTNAPYSPYSPGRNNSFSQSANGAPSRGPTPSFTAPSSVPPTPFQGKHPVSNDEDTEIAVLAEIEREIYIGMEALEDAFEGLHRKAELVRRALRERGAGLSMAAQSRRVSQPDNGIFARLDTPGTGPGYERGWNGTNSEVDAESDWGGDDGQSELAPDDSASNISSSRHRRPKRRNERRTPAPLEEEDEEE